MASWLSRIFGTRSGNQESSYSKPPTLDREESSEMAALLQAAREKGPAQLSSIDQLRRYKKQPKVEKTLIEICRAAQDPEVRAKCVDSLEVYSPSRDVIALLSELFINERNESLRGSVCYHLRSCDAVDFPSLFARAYQQSPSAADRRSFLTTMCKWLRPDNGQSSFDAVYQSITDPAERQLFVDAIADAAAHTSHWDSRLSWGMLEQLDPERAKEVRLSLLKSSDTKLRSSAAYMLPSQDGPDGLDALFEHLASETDADVKKTMVGQLADYGDVRLLPLLLEVLRNPSASDDGKRNAVYNLGKLDDQRATKALIAAVAQSALENEASAALLRSKTAAGIRAVVEVAKRPGTRSDRFASRAASALSEPVNREVDELLTELVMFGMQHPYDSVRMETLRPLTGSALRIPRIRAAVEAAVHDSYDICRSFANSIMAQAGDPATLKKNVSSASVSERNDALEKLARLDDAEAKSVIAAHHARKAKLLKEVCGDGAAADETIAKRLLNLSEVERSIVGECVHEHGGHERMVAVATRYKQLGGNIRLLEGNWDGIGTFRA